MPKKEAGCRVMMVEVMKVAQQPAMRMTKSRLAQPLNKGNRGSS
jgi:hypothetical protein